MPDQPFEDWERLVNQIRAGEPGGQERLYEMFGASLRIYFSHRIHRQDADDLLHDTFISLLSAIRSGQLREPARLPGFVHTIARRQVASFIADAVRQRMESVDFSRDFPLRERSPSPEQEMLEQQRGRLAARVLEELPEAEREVLVRFYFDGQDADEICDQLSLTSTQFRLRKNRGKERFLQLMRKALRREKLFGEFLLRKKAVSGH